MITASKVLGLSKDLAQIVVTFGVRELQGRGVDRVLVHVARVP